MDEHFPCVSRLHCRSWKAFAHYRSRPDYTEYKLASRCRKKPYYMPRHFEGDTSASDLHLDFLGEQRFEKIKLACNPISHQFVSDLVLDRAYGTMQICNITYKIDWFCLVKKTLNAEHEHSKGCQCWQKVNLACQIWKVGFTQPM